jgi:Mlc titration factor MtfA (ptsG expression regulator)
MSYRKEVIINSIKCVELNLEEFRFEYVHADKLLICGDSVFVIEETSSPEVKDVKKITNTVEKLRSGELWLTLSLVLNYERAQATKNMRYYGVLHKNRRGHPMVSKVLKSRATRLEVPMRVVNCNDELRSWIGELIHR